MKKASLLSYNFLVICSIALLTSCEGKPTSQSMEVDPIEVKTTHKKPQGYVVTDSMVRSLFEDSKGNFWLGTDHAGLKRYDGNTITHFTTNDGLSDNQIRTIQEDQNGHIWFATGKGISKYDGEKFTIHKSHDGVVSNNWNKAKHDLWFNGEVEGGVYRYNGTQLSVHKFPVVSFAHPSFSISGTVTAICHGANNMLWMANYGGVIGFDGSAFTYINERKYTYHVRSLFEDSKGNLWIGNNGIGVLRYDGQTTTNFTVAHGLNDNDGNGSGALSREGTLNHVFAIAEDKNGHIWFGDRDTGAWRYDGKTVQNYTLKDGLTNTFVRAIYQDKLGRLLFGLGDGSVSIFNGDTFEKFL